MWEIWRRFCMNLFSKKISLGTSLVITFLIASIMYALAYKISLNKFNNLVSYAQEKQKMYGDLSEIDYIIRNEYIDSVQESSILSNLYTGYINGVNNKNCRLFTRENYEKYIFDKKNNHNKIISEIINNTGYIKCSTLGKNSGDEFIKSVNSLRNNDIFNIIIDLRNNQNGEIDEVFKILKFLVPSGNLVYSILKDGTKEVACESHSETEINNLKFVVLINNNTEGASEVLASGLRDDLDAKLVGEQSVGCAVRLKTTEISGDHMLIFPDAIYVTSKENNFYGIGLNPDESFIMNDEHKKLYETGDLVYSDDEHLEIALNLLCG